MKLRNLFLALIAGATSLVSCDLLNEIEDLGEARVSLDKTEITIPQEGGSVEVSLIATREWMISGDLPDWLALSVNKGDASAKEQTIRVSAQKNEGNDREATVVFTIGFDKASVLVKQPGAQGEYVVPTVTIAEFIKTDGQTEYIVSGKVTSMNADYKYAYISDGTAEVEVYKPTNWDEYVSKIKVGATMKAQGVYTKYTNSSGKSYDELVGVILEVIEKEVQTDVQTVTCAEFIKTDGTTEYIISGKITSMNADYKYAYINDGTAEVEVYKPSNWDEYASKIKVGATMKAQGVYTKYTNSSGKSYDELVGVILEVIEGADGPQGEAKGDGTLDNPYNPAGAAALAKSLAAGTNSDKVYIKGKITNVKTTFEASGTYGNANFYIADATDGTGEFYIFQTYYLGNRQWKSGDTDVKVGDEVIVYGPVTMYNSTPETAGKGASFIYSLNGKTDGGNEEVPQGEAKGDGTLDNPYNPAGAAAVASKLSYTDKDNYQTTDPVYVTGKVSKVSTTFEASGTYGNASFTIVDATDGTGSFEIYQTYYLGNRMWEIGDQEIKVGDVVIVYGPLMNYKGNTPETVGKGASYIYSLNGQTEVAQSPVFGVESADIKVAASATTAEIKVKGNVAWSVARKSDGVTCNPESGEGAATITVTFAANESQENEVSYSVALSTQAEVTNNTIVVNITQGKASSGNVTEVYADFTAAIDGFPTDYVTEGTFTLGGYDWTFVATNGFKQMTNPYTLIIGKKDSYIVLPSVDAKALKRVEFLTGSSASEKVTVDIAKADGTLLNINSSALKKGTEYGWDVSGEVGAKYRIVVTNANNAQFQYIKLYFE